MRKHVLVALVIVGILMVCSACSVGTSLEALIQPPQPNSIDSAISRVVEKRLPKGASLASIAGGDNIQPIQLVDLNGDEVEEIIALYILKDHELPLRGLILTNEDDSWNTEGEIKTAGSSIDSIAYHDITGDDTLEVAITSRSQEYGGKGIGVYDLTQNGLSTLFEGACNEMVFSDLNSDKIAELMLLNSNRTDGNANAVLYEFNGNRLEKSAETALDAFVYIEAAVAGYAAENIPAVFVDMGVGAHSGLTSLLVLKDEKLENVFMDQNKGFTEKTFKAYFAPAKDVDNDGIIEIPLLRAPVGHENTSYAGTPWIHSWYKWDGKDDLILSCESYADYYAGISFAFPENWGENITINCNDRSQPQVEQWIAFSYLDPETRKKHLLFTVYIYDNEQWEKGYQLIDAVEVARKENKVYAVVVEEEGLIKGANDARLTLEDIKSRLELMDWND